MAREGAELAFTYQNEKLKSRVEDAAKEYGAKIVLPCDVGEDQQIDDVFSELGKHWDGLDILVHSVGFAPREALDGEFLAGLTRESFRIAHDISSYSLAALSKAARPMMKGRGGSILTLSYLGAERALANYNVMGLAKASLEANVRYLALNLGPEGTRVNAISAARSRRWPRPASPTSARCSRTSRSTRRCAAASPSRTSATSPPSCARTWPRASPASHLRRRRLQRAGHDRHRRRLTFA
jgi:enoyl-[acyl-carrier-protein] reductase (NADH)